jgi:glycosyltransferase involved in cell wall biosynthesis
MASAGKRLRVLFLSQRFPYPMDTGGKIRTGKLLEELSEIFDISLISNVELPKDAPHLAGAGRLCERFHPVPWREVPRRSPRFYARLATQMLVSYPVSVLNDYSRNLEATVLALLGRERFDLAVCDFLQSTLNFRRVTGLPTLLFQHNVESMILRRHVAMASNRLAKAFWQLQLARMERHERAMCARFSGVVAVSDVDKRVLETEFGARRVFTIPTGVDTEFFAPGPGLDEGLVFTGSMDWLPNEDGIGFFAKEIMGSIRAAVPGVGLRVVGRRPSKTLLRELQGQPGIDVVGWVEDVRPYVRDSAVYVIPLRIGGGTRIKAFEAMAMGKAVVSTRVGVEGLPVRDGEHLLLADTPQEFSAAVVRLLHDEATRRRLGSAARRFVEENFSWRRAALAFADACHAVVERGPDEGMARRTREPCPTTVTRAGG